jgi:hypothetical protein
MPAAKNAPASQPTRRLRIASGSNACRRPPAGPTQKLWGPGGHGDAGIAGFGVPPMRGLAALRHGLGSPPVQRLRNGPIGSCASRRANHQVLDLFTLERYRRACPIPCRRPLQPPIRCSPWSVWTLFGCSRLCPAVRHRWQGAQPCTRADGADRRRDAGPAIGGVGRHAAAGAEGARGAVGLRVHVLRSLPERVAPAFAPDVPSMSCQTVGTNQKLPQRMMY